jgi:CheY-like chemotaxis protein
MKILLVEDDEEVMYWLSTRLSEAGHEILSAVEGDWALATWKTHHPFDCVVTDNLFPGKAVWNGRMLIDAIRAIDPGQPFVMQTTSASVDLPRGVPLLRKPYRIGRLLRMLASAKSQRLPLLDHPLTSQQIAGECCDMAHYHFSSAGGQL